MLNCKVKSERDRMLWKRKISRREYLSPALALRCVELQAQQSGSDHAEPVDVHHILSILAIMSKNTGTHTQTKAMGLTWSSAATQIPTLVLGAVQRGEILRKFF